MNRLYQWLSKRVSFFHSDASCRETSRTIRTEVTVERQGITVLLDGTTAVFDVSPLCGNKLTLADAEQAIALLQKASISGKPTSAAHERKLK